MASESEGGNVGKYQRLKGGKNSREKQRIECPLEGQGKETLICFAESSP